MMPARMAIGFGHRIVEWKGRSRLPGGNERRLVHPLANEGDRVRQAIQVGAGHWNAHCGAKGIAGPKQTCGCFRSAGVDRLFGDITQRYRQFFGETEFSSVDKHLAPEFCRTAHLARQGECSGQMRGQMHSKDSVVERSGNRERGLVQGRCPSVVALHIGKKPQIVEGLLFPAGIAYRARDLEDLFGIGFRQGVIARLDGMMAQDG